jgi:hypothetical protein
MSWKPSSALPYIKILPMITGTDSVTKQGTAILVQAMRVLLKRERTNG